MHIPEYIEEKAKRRVYLWRKNYKQGLTEEEIKEYRRLTRFVNDYIKKHWQEDWESVKLLARKTRIRFKKENK